MQVQLTLILYKGRLLDPRHYILIISKTLFPMTYTEGHLLNPETPVPLQACVAGMFEFKEFGAFKQHARDFLVQTKQFADKDNADLFAEEHEKQGQVRSPYPRVYSVYLCRNTRVVLCQRSDLPEGECSLAESSDATIVTILQVAEVNVK